MFQDIPFDKQQPEKILRRDFFHCSKIGSFRDFIGSTVLLLCKLNYFTQPKELNNIKVLLQWAHGHFRLFCAASGKHPALHSFTPDNFNCNSAKKFPWCKTKGSDTTLLMDWLRCLTRSCLNNPLQEFHVPILEQMNRGSSAAHAWSKALYKHGMWLPRTCAATLYKEGLEFLTCYNALAYACMRPMGELRFCGYAMKPKLHLLAHLLYEIHAWLADPTIEEIPSLLLYCCESNEDVIGKCSRIMRRVHAKQAPRDTLMRYLTKAKALYKRQFQDQGKVPSHKRKRQH